MGDPALIVSGDDQMVCATLEHDPTGHFPDTGSRVFKIADADVLRARPGVCRVHVATVSVNTRLRAAQERT